VLHLLTDYISNTKNASFVVVVVFIGILSMSEEDWGLLADEQEKKLASTVCRSTLIRLLSICSIITGG